MSSRTISGAYAITNTITGNRYVGRGKDVSNRKAWHFCRMRKGLHKNWKLQSDFNQHGQDSFTFEIIETVDSHDKRVSIEQTFIDSPEFGYNMVRNANGGGPPVTEATRKAMGDAHKGKRHTPETIEKIKNRPVEETGGFIGYYHTPAGVFPSSYAAEEGMGEILNFTTVRRWYQNPDKVISKQSYGKSAYLKSFGEGVIGKTYRDLGFSFVAATGSV